MAFEETWKSLSRLLAGAGAVAAAPLFLPGVEKVARPILKTAIRGYLGVVDSAGSPGEWLGSAARRTEEAMEHARERLVDLVEEARAERADAMRRAADRAARTQQTAEGGEPGAEPI